MPYWVHLTGKHPKLIENAREYNKKGQTGEITAFFYMVHTGKWPDFSPFYSNKIHQHKAFWPAPGPFKAPRGAPYGPNPT